MQKNTLLLWGLIFFILIETLAFGEYNDVPKSHWAYESVEKLSALGVITGFPDGTFRGNEVLTRFQVAVLLYRLYSVIDENLKSINSRITALQEKLSAKPTTQDPQTQQAIENLQKNQDKIKAELNAEIESIKSALNKISQDLKKVSQDISTLSSNLKDSNLSVNSKINETQQRQSELNLKIDDLYAKYSNYNSRIEMLEKSYTSISSSLSSIKSSLESLQNSINKQLSELSEFNEQLKADMHQAEIRDLTTQIKNITERLSALESLREESKSLREKLAEVEKALSELKQAKEETVIVSPLDTDKMNELVKQIDAIKEELKSLKANDSNFETSLVSILSKLE
ncbi:S-layer homology domain-containing protein, partial [Fervidobacterium sp.]